MITTVYLVYDGAENIRHVGHDLSDTYDVRDQLERESVLKGNNDIGEWTVERVTSGKVG